MNDRDDWDAHWERFAESARHNPAQDFRFRFIASRVVRLSPKSLIDVGCGQGDLLQYLSNSAPEIQLTGIELSHSGVQISRQKVPSARIVMCDLLADPAQTEVWALRAQCVTCSEVLEHTDDPLELLKRARSLLEPGGTIVITVPGGPMSKFDKSIGHRRHFSRIDLMGLCKSAGLRPIEVSSIGFPFFNLYRLVVLLRGERIAKDASDEPSRVARFVMGVFRLLFLIPIPLRFLGWQQVAIAEALNEPGGIE